MSNVTDLETQRRRDMARVVVRVMQEWGLPPVIQARLLGTDEATPGALLGRFEAGMEENAESWLLQRMSALLSIHKALRQMHPQSEEMANYWVTTPHPYFNERPPVELMLDRGLEGMLRIIDHLNGRGDWC